MQWGPFCFGNGCILACFPWHFGAVCVEWLPEGFPCYADLAMVLGGPGYVKDGRQGGHGHRASLSLVCLLVKEIFIPLLVTQKGSKALGRVGVRE